MGRIKVFGIMSNMSNMSNMTNLQKEVVNYMMGMPMYNTWGFSAIGYREYARINNKNQKAVSNAMRSLLKNGVFHASKCSDRYSDNIYYLNNKNYENRRGIAQND